MTLSLWQNFYVIVGSSGAALIGVQFVVIALIANFRNRVSSESVNAFGTPTVVHLGGAIAISAVMSAPWPSLLGVSIAMVVGGVCGLGYAAITFRRARRQTTYVPVMEDWIWYTVLPSAIYATLVLAGLLLGIAERAALFVIGGATLCLLFVGIHNAWDTVTHIVIGSLEKDTTKPE